jgi:hypothetical protein
LKELKEEESLKMEWVPNDENSFDLFTKNLQGLLFEKHTEVYVSNMV